MSRAVCLVAVPSGSFESGDPGCSLYPDISKAVRDALASERRIKTTPDIVNERKRYTLLCQSIEDAVLGCDGLSPVSCLEDIGRICGAGKLAIMRMDGSYLDFLRLVREPPARLGAGFFHPEQIDEHVRAFKAECTSHGFNDSPFLMGRASFFKAAVEAGCGVVEILEPFTGPEQDNALTQTIRRARATRLTEERERKLADSKVELHRYDLLEEEPFDDPQKASRLAELIDRFTAAISQGQPICPSNSPNDVLTEALRSLAFLPEGELPSPARVRVVYADGSEANPFLIRALRPGEPRNIIEASGSLTLRQGLITMRHQELDRVVSCCFFPNQEASRSRTHAESHEYCYDKAKAEFLELLEPGPLVLHLYSTGFEPAILGFYSALAEVIDAGYPIAVRPYYYRGENNPCEPGSWWA